MNAFEQLGLNPEVVKAVTDLGFTEPTPVQLETIPLLLNQETDIVALAQTGTGKTAAFGLPIVQLTDNHKPHVQSLVICPTRELCLQISSDLANFSRFKPGMKVVAVYGGASIGTQISAIKRGVQVIIATPGRLIDLIERGVIDLARVRRVVLDEADEMLNMGFQEDITSILSNVPPERQTWLFSATMPPEVEKISRKYMNKPVSVTLGKRNEGASTIEHIYYVVQSRDRYAALKRVMDFNPGIYGIVFCRTKAETQEVADKLIKDGYNADALHGDLSQAQRDFVMKRFRARRIQMLVATDVAARGIDVDDITHVINYNLPDEPESYTHRSGRTGRAGRTGVSLAIINSKETGRIREIEKITGRKFVKGKVPDGKSICERQLFHLVHGIHETKVEETEIGDYLPAIMEELKDLSREDLIRKFFFVEFKRFYDFYKTAPDLNMESGQQRRDNRGRFFINVGRLDGLDNSRLLKFVCDTTGLSGSDIGRIEIKNSFSFFEADESQAQHLINAMEGVTFRGRPVQIEVSEPFRGGGRSEKRGERGGFGGKKGGHRGQSGFHGKRDFSDGKGREERKSGFDGKRASRDKGRKEFFLEKKKKK